MKSSPPILRDLGDGLVLRRATRADSRALVTFNLQVFSHPDTGKQEPELGAWVRDMMRGTHPTFHPDDFTLVEDTRAGKIVSAMCHISQTWQYDGIEFGVGRPELVATDNAYRRRGLIRAQFEMLHQCSAERGELVQAISGIPNFYRQFGYEYALGLGGAKVSFVPQNVPALKKGEKEPYPIRRAVVADAPFIARTYAQSTRRSLVACVRDERMWQYELTGRSRASVIRLAWSIIETPSGTPVGMLAHRDSVVNERIGVGLYEVESRVSWLDVTPSVLRYLQKVGAIIAAREHRVFNSIGFWLGAQHPAYQALGERAPRTVEAYAWYLRVADVPAYLSRIAPVLNRRLAESTAAGFTGALQLNFYRGGARLTFENGTLTRVEPWNATHVEPGHSGFGNAAFPDLTFLQVLFGYRSVRELQSAFPDCLMDNDQTLALLEILFPKQHSSVLAIS